MTTTDQPTFVPFCEEYHSFLGRTLMERQAYVAAELRRLDASGAPVLRAVLSHPYDGCRNVSLALLAPENGNAVQGSGDPVLTAPRHVWWLRLVEGAELPPTDPQGRRLPDEIRGKVLRAKVGLVGWLPGDPSTHDPAAVAAAGGEARRKRESTGRDLYLTTDVTRDPRPYPFQQAVIILRAYGRGVAGELNRQLVEEVPPPDHPAARPAQARAAR